MSTVLDEMEFTAAQVAEPPPPSAMDGVISLMAMVMVIGMMTGMVRSMRSKT